MYTVGKINREIYGCISADIANSEVVITERQIAHIKDKHPEAYEEVQEYLKEALEKPDYILEDKHENTGLIVKKINNANEWGQIVLRVCTSTDVIGYKNSIISYWKISDKRFSKLFKK